MPEAVNQEGHVGFVFFGFLEDKKTLASTKTRAFSKFSESFQPRMQQFMYHEQTLMKFAIERRKNGVTSCPYSRELLRVCFNILLPK